MSASEELERGQLAADVLTNRVYAESMAQIEREITEKWQNEPDFERQKWLWTLMQAHRKLHAVLRDTMQTGQLRQKQIEQERSRSERIGNAFMRR